MAFPLSAEVCAERVEQGKYTMTGNQRSAIGNRRSAGLAGARLPVIRSGMKARLQMIARGFP